MTVALTEWDGTAVGAATPYDLVFPIGGDLGYTSDVSLTDRADWHPVPVGQRQNARTVPFLIRQGSTAPAPAQWQSDVMRVFNEDARADRILRGTHNGVTLRIKARITTIRPHTSGAALYEGTFVFPDPAWQYDTAVTGATSPITPAGNRPATPKVYVTAAAGNLMRLTMAVVDQSGSGLMDYWVRIGPFDSSGMGVTDARHFLVMAEGLPLPFYASYWGSPTATTVDVIMNVPANEQINLSVYYGSDLNNTVTAQALDLAGFYPSHASFSNTRRVWNTLANVASNPNRPGAWRLGRVGPGDSFLASATTTTVVLQRDSSGALGGLDCLYLNLGAPALGGPISGLTVSAYAPSNLPNGLASFGMYTRKPGESAWTMANVIGYQPNPTLPAGVSEVAFVSLPSSSGLDVTMNAAVITVDLDPAGVPSVTPGIALPAARIEGAITNTTTGETITITDTLVDANLPIIIDAETGAIIPDSVWHPTSLVPSAEGPIFTLRPGVANVITAPANVTVTADYRPRIAV